MFAHTTVGEPRNFLFERKKILHCIGLKVCDSNRPQMKQRRPLSDTLEVDESEYIQTSRLIRGTVIG
ncbi:hypothetical protein DQQ10_16705 [Pseudochryseolinea flava]|uniref:Uncharacterized protein n=1 Tax=Pseudochryseolinea flava TaxID=2059302 RepID=A0A364Y341_9BACT|nr:hypothetical protein DQQ10_16705 [Pseudochryseolinea flava]